MLCAMAAACWKRTCVGTAELLLHCQVSWGCLQVPGAALCHHVWGGLKDARQPGEHVWWPGGCGHKDGWGRRAGSEVQAVVARRQCGRVGDWPPSDLPRTCGRVHMQRGELCLQRGLHRGEVSALPTTFTGLVGKAAGGGMLVGEMSLNPCPCTTW